MYVITFPWYTLQVGDITEACLVKVVPTPNNGYPELVSLVKQKVRSVYSYPSQ